MLTTLKDKIFSGENINRSDLALLNQLNTPDLMALSTAVRLHFCGQAVDLCSIINARSGGCSEDCRFCAQSAHYGQTTLSPSLLSAKEICQTAIRRYRLGVYRFSMVTAGRGLSDSDIVHLKPIYRQLNNGGVLPCGSHGLLSQAQLQELKDAGMRRYHNNLETSARLFPSLCSSHSYEDKLATLSAAKAVGLEICSGGIFGLGETMDDRLDMAFTLRAIGVSSIPINILVPIPGTPLAKALPLSDDELIRSVAFYRLIHPTAFIRLAGGRGNRSDQGRSLLAAGANALITGDMLTTSGYDIDSDRIMLKEMGYDLCQRDILSPAPQQM